MHRSTRKSTQTCIRCRPFKQWTWRSDSYLHSWGSEKMNIHSHFPRLVILNSAPLRRTRIGRYRVLYRQANDKVNQRWSSCQTNLRPFRREHATEHRNYRHDLRTVILCDPWSRVGGCLQPLPQTGVRRCSEDIPARIAFLTQCDQLTFKSF